MWIVDRVSYKKVALSHMFLLRRCLLAVILAVGVAVSVSSRVVHAQGIDVANRPIAQVRVQGLDEVSLQLVLNQVRLHVGDPYDKRVVEEDIIRITHLGRFDRVSAAVEPQGDGTVVLTYVVVEQPVITDVEVVGNKNLADQELLSTIGLHRGDPVDRFLIDRAIQQIKRAYKKAGYFSVGVRVDEKRLKTSGVLVFQVREGLRIWVKKIGFEGNTVFTDRQLRSKISSTTHLFILRKGVLNRQQLDADAARVRDFYHEHGYLDAQVGRRIDVSPDNKNATVVFLIREGQQYQVDGVRVKGNQVFGHAQIMEYVALKTGQGYTADRLRRTRQGLVGLYGQLGFIEADIQIDRLYHEQEPKLDLLITIDEGLSYLVGTVMVRGNQLTWDKVIYREIRGMEPGRRFDRAGIKLTEQRLRESRLFSAAKVTILGESGDKQRDVLIDVKEANTGSLSFGAGISSDAGVLGSIDLVQRNFDITNPPDSWGELISGRGFRGGGQYFALSMQPGNELSRYSASFRDPYAFDTDYFFSASGSFFERQREDFDEQRLGTRFGVGKRFGDVWSSSIRLRAEDIDISSIDRTAPVDVFEVEGGSLLTSVGWVVSRNTTDSRVFPTQGSRTRVEISRTGAFGGDFDFTSLHANYNKYWTLGEDFYERRTVLGLRVELGYIFEADKAPVFERFYAGGHRSFRGFDFRGVGPRGVRNDTGQVGNDPVGGDWLLLVGLEYNVPIYKDVVRAVMFTDTGTVQDRFGIDEFRVSVGVGMRLKLPFFGQAPFALDFAVPVVEQDGDETRVFSFDLALPF